MKTMIFAGVVALALTSMAQGTAPAATATAAPAKTTMAPKKAAKKATAKKATKKPAAQPATSQAAPAAPVAPVAVEAAAPAATSVATNTAPAAPAKKWGASITVNPSSSFETPASVGALTTLGGSYKVTDSWKMGLKHTFESVAVEAEEGDSRDYVNTNNFRSAYTDLSVSTSLPSLMGSDAIPFAAGYRHVSRDALVTRTGGLAPINAHLDLSVVPSWTLTPKATLSAYTAYRHFDMNNDGADRMIVQPSASYAINDMISVYQAAGLLYSTNTAWELRKRRERLLLETGVDISPMKGLSINLNVNQDKAISTTAANETVTGFAMYRPTPITDAQKAEAGNSKLSTLDAVSYEAVISYSF